jgi:hypothetical protein
MECFTPFEDPSVMIFRDGFDTQLTNGNQTI